jgi:CRISP-associated protein Cas1
VSHRVVSVSGPGFARLSDRHLAIVKNGSEVGRVPIEDIATLVLDGPDLSISHQLLGACISHGVVVIVTDDRHLPAGYLLPIAGHSLHTKILREQIESSVPAKKRAWQAVVKGKISAQADLVSIVGQDSKHLRKLSALVRSGDPDNVEARAAAITFESVFGKNFTRDRDSPGINGLLNYGYAIVRAAVARSVVGSGLHPSIGIQHHNQYNALCLADDAMEPLRPLVDYYVWQWIQNSPKAVEVVPQSKRHLVSVLGCFLYFKGELLPFFVALERYAASLRRSICEGADLDVVQPNFDLKR